MESVETKETQVTTAQKDPYKPSRIFYIIEAALEYFIATMVGEAYLAKLTGSLGIPDDITGILTAFVQLGNAFQILAIFLVNRTPVKRWVTVSHIINQLLFTLLYVLPVAPIPQGLRTPLFILFLLGGHIINSVINSPKINWFMSLVDNDKRGRFTANKEIISLLSGMVFTLSMSRIIDSYEARGDLNGAFILIGITLFVLMTGHTLTLLFSKEKESTVKVSVGESLKSIVKDPGFFKVVFVSVLWTCAAAVSTPFYGTYRIHELGFSMTFVSILSAGYSIVRSLFSRPLGKFADKHSFVSMLNICFIIAALAFGLNVFCTPANGKFVFTAYYLLYAIAMAGINSSAINLIYDYVKPEQRMSALAIKSSLAGVLGFLTTLVSSRLVSYIQAREIVIFGMKIYAQQFTSAITFTLILGLLLYNNLVVRRMKREE